MSINWFLFHIIRHSIFLRAAHSQSHCFPCTFSFFPVRAQGLQHCLYHWHSDQVWRLYLSFVDLSFVTSIHGES
ncbi:hypothetical protein K469DRAFT_317724 [Zopfia rhizophila CBS 207.26]|uniref:C2H2-type domain-containing protein n=1 Tax=Zopfia rhizophila CBS 207.26 TaxID=1314779 RepID=A0A6A6EPL5_9PEZI|nr:hypothetical protein K469DRAFT_317724 [Zopfia rhizophila CBS 207.26]